MPRTRLAEVLGRIGEMGDEAGLRVANVFHAGDGNLHPLVLYSAAAGETDRAEHLSGAIAELCVELGGSLSGEHGIGTDKACSMPKMFGEDDLATMARVRAAFDPHGLCNPGKVLPDAAAVRRAPGSLPAAPARGGGRDRAAVMSETRPDVRRRRRRRGATVTATLMNPTDLRGVRDAVLDSAGALAVAGAGTAAGWAGTLGPVDAVLDLRALTGVITHNPGDMTVSVRAGTPLRELNAELAGHGQHVALDAARVADGATVGGLLSTGDAGPGALVHGSLRDLVIGATLVLADGTVARTGGHVIKNVAGYDLAKLVHGAYGTLAVIAEVVLRLHPLPHATATLVLPCPLAGGRGARRPGPRRPVRARGAGVGVGPGRAARAGRGHGGRAAGADGAAAGAAGVGGAAAAGTPRTRGTGTPGSPAGRSTTPYCGSGCAPPGSRVCSPGWTPAGSPPGSAPASPPSRSPPTRSPSPRPMPPCTPRAGPRCCAAARSG